MMAGMHFRLLALLAAWLLATGCSWFSASLEVRAQVPEIPEHWRQAFPELRFELACLGSEPLSGTASALPGGWATLRLPRRVNWPVLAYPRARGVRLPPAGGLFPMDLGPEGDSLVLSWEHGPAAEVLQSLAREGFDIGCLNTPRLVEEMRERSGGDPGCLDLESLAGRLASGEFRVTDIRLLPARDLEVGLPPATWFLESPFRPAQPLAAGQALVLSAVPLGLHRLFAVEQEGGYDLFVGEREVLRVPLAGDPSNHLKIYSKDNR
jgi:hypothetical protein